MGLHAAKCYSPTLGLSPKALRKSAAESPTNLPVFNLQSLPLHEERAQFGHAAALCGLQWMKGMAGTKRQTEGIQLI